ncbi:MAG: putative DNA binding domain-containing protein [Clostridiales Family XIII bacterium]|jgi:ATP-dependent DNA helicase RecG|nr:putative DNA binding domain-containing protein [Clostridiales Family XIII bacterium]
MIPLKLETLLKGRVVEQDRVEYKKGWNPADTIHAVCAYANDFTNMNGGYVVIGIEEDNGRPLLPPAGIDENDLDRIQNELFEYCNQIEPRYLPQLEITEHGGKKLIYLWCSAGDAGPYKAPVDIYSKKKKNGAKDEKRKEYWIKPFSVKTIAKQSELFELFEKFNAVPFDDRVSRGAKAEDIQMGHLRDFLVESNSALAEDVFSRPVADTLLSLEVANVTDVGVDIRNIGILMFSDRPEKFMPGARIELVWFHSPEEEGSDGFTEKTFTGPLFRQVKDALRYIETSVIEEKVVKVPGRAEADRYFNFPYEALEEALANACQHKSYQIPEAVEIRVYLNRIMIINYPGPAPWIDMEKFREGKAVSRRYRNRRIGEFFKEIDLAEKKSTGIKKILRTLANNGSPPPTFETDSARNSLETTIWIHEGFKTWGISRWDQILADTGNTRGGSGFTENFTENLTEKEKDLIDIILCESGITTAKMAERLGISRQTVSVRLKQLGEKGLICRTGSDTKGNWQIIREP